MREFRINASTSIDDDNYYRNILLGALNSPDASSLVGWRDLQYLVKLALNRLDDNAIFRIMEEWGFDSYFPESSNIYSATDIVAADEDEPETLEDRADELRDRIEDDFDYVLAGVERLGREGDLDSAMDIMGKIANTLDSAIGVIGDTFNTESAESTDSEDQEF